MTCVRVREKELNIIHPVVSWTLLDEVCTNLCSDSLDRFADMILRRRIEFCGIVLLVTTFLSKIDGSYSSIDRHVGGVNGLSAARKLLKNWRRKAQEQSVRYGTPNPEIHLTPVYYDVYYLCQINRFE